MNKFIKLVAILTTAISLITITSCKKTDLKETYEKENAGTTGYGATVKSSIYIDDFYFLTVGTVKSKVELLIGSAHYCENNNELLPVYNLQNGDSISIEYDNREKAITKATYTYTNGDEVSFFDILVELGLLRSSTQQSGGNDTTVVPGTETDYLPTDPDKDDTENNGGETTVPDKTPTIPERNENPTDQSNYFASGMYNYTLIEPNLLLNMQRSNILAAVGKPNYYYSHNFTNDSYVIDCYNLKDGSKLYLDYGYGRDNLRCAAIYKNGVYTSVVGKWVPQGKPDGFTRMGVDKSKITSLSKNMTPISVYKRLGEPSWFEGNRGSYSDVYALTDGSFAYLNFGSAHNKLTSVSIKGADGSETVITIK